MTVPRLKGTRRQVEIALSRKEANPLAARAPFQSSHANKANNQYRNADSFLASLIFSTPAWAAEAWPVLSLDLPSYHPFQRLDTRPRNMRRQRRYGGDAWLAMDLSPRVLAVSLGDSLRAEVRQATKVPGKDANGNTLWPHSVLLY